MEGTPFTRSSEEPSTIIAQDKASSVINQDTSAVDQDKAFVGQDKATSSLVGDNSSFLTIQQDKAIQPLLDNPVTLVSFFQ